MNKEDKSLRFWRLSANDDHFCRVLLRLFLAHERLLIFFKKRNCFVTQKEKGKITSSPKTSWHSGDKSDNKSFSMLIINTRLLGPPIFPISQISVMLSHFVLRQRLDSVLLIFSISNTDNSNRSVNNPYFHLFLSSTVSHFCFHSTIVCISLLITLALFYINITVYTFSWHPIYQLFYCLRIFTRSTSTDQNQVWESSNGSMLKSIKCVLQRLPESYDLLRHCIEPLKQCMYFHSSQTTTRRNKQRIMRSFMLTLKISEGGAWINA